MMYSFLSENTKKESVINHKQQSDNNLYLHRKSLQKYCGASIYALKRMYKPYNEAEWKRNEISYRREIQKCGNSIIQTILEKEGVTQEGFMNGLKQAAELEEIIKNSLIDFPFAFETIKDVNGKVIDVRFITSFNNNSKFVKSFVSDIFKELRRIRKYHLTQYPIYNRLLTAPLFAEENL